MRTPCLDLDQSRQRTRSSEQYPALSPGQNSVLKILELLRIKNSLKVIQLVESRSMHKNNGLPAICPRACTYHSQHSPSLLICSGNVLETPASAPAQVNIAKGTTDPRVEFILQVLTQILIKFHLQNLDQASTSKFQPNISLSTKLKLQNLNQTKLQNLDQDKTS